MTLDDLLIYGDWLEENNIKTSLYKLFLNLLRINLRRNMFCKWSCFNGCLSTGDGIGYGGDYGQGNGNGVFTPMSVKYSVISILYPNIWTLMEQSAEYFSSIVNQEMTNAMTVGEI